MTNLRFLLLSCFVFVTLPLFAQNFLEKFEKLGTKPESIELVSNLKFSAKGGHLQGIQLIPFGIGEYALMTGSSNSYSYYAVVRLGMANEIIAVNKILDRPYKHAGGFQIAGNWLAIGIEDNASKKSSKVFVCQLGNLEEEALKPYVVIDREGEAKRQTAGCVAIMEKRAGLLVVVGDWDTKHLDFYLIDDKLKAELVYTIDTEKMSREGWTDDKWLAYQNINLVKDGDAYYLIGLGAANEQDVADVFELSIKDWKEFSLMKVASKNFGSQEKTKFRWGAGVNINDEGKLRIISCEDHLKSGTIINVYN